MRNSSLKFLIANLITFSVLVCNVHAKKRNSTYRITESDAGLATVSVRLYGTPNLWQEIAKLNRIRPPYIIRNGRALKLPRPATLKPHEGEAAVLAFYHASISQSSANRVDANELKDTSRSPAAEEFSETASKAKSITQYDQMGLSDKIALLRSALRKKQWKTGLEIYEEIVNRYPDTADLPFLVKSRTQLSKKRLAIKSKLPPKEPQEAVSTESSETEVYRAISTEED